MSKMFNPSLMLNTLFFEHMWIVDSCSLVWKKNKLCFDQRDDKEKFNRFFTLSLTLSTQWKKLSINVDEKVDNLLF